MCSESTDSDNFDRLPDALVLFIFNKLQDAKSLTKCLVVSKRFFSLIPFTNTVFISIPQLHNYLSSPITSWGSCMNMLRLAVHNLFLKPLKCFHQIMGPKSSHYDQPNGSVLKNFKEIKSLHLEFPAHGEDHELLGSDSGASFLKWKAEFGTNLKSCIILGATSFQRSDKLSSSSSCFQQEECMEKTVTDDELKLRVIWTISCLIAASTRHHWLKQILAEHPIPMLQSLLISDGNKQGKLCMGKEELVELRSYYTNSEQEITLESSTMERTPVPELSMKLWYLPELELPESGYVMEGATLVFIRPVDEMRNGDLMVGNLDLEVDGKAFSEAVREMIKVKKSYLMTMSSF